MIRRTSTPSGEACRRRRRVAVDGELMVIDEWEAAEQFQSFFEANPPDRRIHDRDRNDRPSRGGPDPQRPPTEPGDARWLSRRFDLALNRCYERSGANECDRVVDHR